MLTHSHRLLLSLLFTGCASTAPQRLAVGTNTHFAWSQTTTRGPEIWRLWTDVTTWPQWDGEVEFITLEGPFALGARGVLKGKGAPPAAVVITRFEPGARYEFSTELPLGGRLIIVRALDGDRFSHDVRFEGLGGWLLAPVVGPRYREALPRVLDQLKTLAEQSP